MADTMRPISSTEEQPRYMKLTRIKITNQTSKDVFCIFSTSVPKKKQKINNMTTTYSRLCATLQWLLHFKRAHLSYYY